MKLVSNALKLHVTLVYSPAARVLHVLEIALPPGACVQDALGVGAQDERFAAVLAGKASNSIGKWGKRISMTEPLHEGDRIEIYRSLRVDPKVARRERFKKQGAKSAGLFAKRRPGAKPGY